MRVTVQKNAGKRLSFFDNQIMIMMKNVFLQLYFF